MSNSTTDNFTKRFLTDEVAPWGYRFWLVFWRCQFWISSSHGPSGPRFFNRFSLPIEANGGIVHKIRLPQLPCTNFLFNSLSKIFYGRKSFWNQDPDDGAGDSILKVWLNWTIWDADVSPRRLSLNFFALKFQCLYIVRWPSCHSMPCSVKYWQRD
jgi:hypothetical protein